MSGDTGPRHRRRMVDRRERVALGRILRGEVTLWDRAVTDQIRSDWGDQVLGACWDADALYGAVNAITVGACLEHMPDVESELLDIIEGCPADER